MSWTAPSGHVWTTGEVVSAANMNTYIKDNLIDLDRRTSPVTALVDTAEGTTSTTFVALATAGPAVTVTIGATGLAEITVFSAISNNTTDQGGVMGYAISGASTVASRDGYSVSYSVSFGGVGANQGATFLDSGLTAGSNTFTSQYKRAGTGTATFTFRKIIITPLGS